MKGGGHWLGVQDTIDVLAVGFLSAMKVVLDRDCCRGAHELVYIVSQPCEDSTGVAVKVQVPKKSSAVKFALHPVGKILLVLLVLGFTTGLAVFTYYYVKYSRLIDTKLAAGPFAATSMLFAAPRTVDVGDVADPQEIASDLRRSGYTESTSNRMGYFTAEAGRD